VRTARPGRLPLPPAAAIFTGIEHSGRHGFVGPGATRRLAAGGRDVRAISFIPILLLAFVGCNADSPTDPPGNVADHEWYGWFEWESDWSHMSGQGAFFWDTGADVVVAVATVSGDHPGAARRWYLGTDGCSAEGFSIGSFDDYPPLLIGGQGQGGAAAALRLEPDPTAAYHIRLFDAVDRYENPMACANLTLVPSN
jgi:hypothetical protein